MKALNEFIIHIAQPYSETIKTKGGLEIYGDKRWSPERMANRIGKVIALPVNHNTEIQEGYEVLIDPTVLYEQIYHLTHGRQDSVFLVDKEKNYYKVEPKMIVLYRENEQSAWKAYLENGIYEQVVNDEAEMPLESAFIHITPSNMKQYKENRASLKYGNESILQQVAVGQELVVKGDMGIPFFMDGETYLWYRNTDVIAAVN